MVDDDVDFLSVSKTVLEEAGHTVLTANNIGDGEQKVKMENPELILLDIMMQNPDDGINLAHKLRKDNIHTPIIMLSCISSVMGYSYKCDEVLPCTDFVSKPVAPQALLDRVDNILKK